MNMFKSMRKLRILIMPILAIIIFLIFATALNNFDSGRKENSMMQLETAIRRSCAAYYATEGVYPPDLDTLTDKFGIQINEKYVVYYDIFADNLMPDITVLENTQ